MSIDLKEIKWLYENGRNVAHFVPKFIAEVERLTKDIHNRWAPAVELAWDCFDWFRDGKPAGTFPVSAAAFRAHITKHNLLPEDDHA